MAHSLYQPDTVEIVNRALLSVNGLGMMVGIA